MAEPMDPTACSTPENICDVSDQRDGKNHRYDARNYWESQKYAISGVRLILKNERNFRIQLTLAFLAVAAGLLFNLTHQDWVALCVVIALVLIAETFNSVTEAVCDTISKDFRLNIKYAKDVSAGAVLVSAVVSLVAGVIIFSPYVWNFAVKLLGQG